jgi:3-hydroxy-3-methylglutaryl CoA synthase
MGRGAGGAAWGEGGLQEGCHAGSTLLLIWFGQGCCAAAHATVAARVRRNREEEEKRKREEKKRKEKKRKKYRKFFKLENFQGQK